MTYLSDDVVFRLFMYCDIKTQRKLILLNKKLSEYYKNLEEKRNKGFKNLLLSNLKFLQSAYDSFDGYNMLFDSKNMCSVESDMSVCDDAEIREVLQSYIFYLYNVLIISSKIIKTKGKIAEYNYETHDVHSSCDNYLYGMFDGCDEYVQPNANLCICISTIQYMEKKN